jgi:hypothetical protein
MLEGIHVVSIAHAFRGPRNIDIPFAMVRNPLRNMSEENRIRLPLTFLIQVLFHNDAYHRQAQKGRIYHPYAREAKCTGYLGLHRMLSDIHFLRESALNLRGNRVQIDHGEHPW